MFGIRTLSAFALLTLAHAALAGSLITTNVPTGTTIVNIDAAFDGAANSSDNFSNWYQPFSTNVSLTLAPGTYSFTVINAADAHVRFPSLTSGQLANVHGAWTYNSPWLTDWMAFDSSALSDPGQSQLLSGAVTTVAANNELDAYNLSKAAGTLGQLKISPGGRANGTIAYSYTLTQTRTLLFDIPDQGVGDNAGGVSVIVQSVPEPASFAALALGGLGLLRRRRRA